MMVAGNWYLITLAALSGWTNPIPALSAEAAEAIDTGATLLVFCTADNLNLGLVAEVVSLAGGRYKLQHSAVTITASPTIDVSPTDDGDVWTSVRRGDGAWLFYSEQGGTVRAMTTPGTFGAFVS